MNRRWWLGMLGIAGTALPAEAQIIGWQQAEENFVLASDGQALDLAARPIAEANNLVFVNGLKMLKGTDYVLSTRRISWNYPSLIPAGASVSVVYWR